MTSTLILPPGTDRDEWLQLRRSYLGGSDIAAVMNVSPYDGPLSVWMSKLHGRSKDVTDAMSIGIHMEPWIMRKYASLHPTYAVEAAPGMYVADGDHDDAGRTWRAANPDGIATLPDGRRAVVEIKTAARYGDDTNDTWGDEGTDEIPYAYLCQVTWTCAVMDCGLWVVPVLFDGRDYREYRGRLEPELAQTLIGRGRSWWNRHIVGGEEPPADHRETTRDILLDRWAGSSSKRTFAQVDDPNLLQLQAAYCRIREQINDMKTQRDEAANQIRQAHVQADVEELRHAGYTISTLTTTKTGSVRLNVKEHAS